LTSLRDFSKNIEPLYYSGVSIWVLRDVLVCNGKAKLFPTNWKRDVVAGAFIVHNSNIASTKRLRRLMLEKKLEANDLIQWKVIKHLKGMGLRKYVLHGIILDKRGRSATGVSSLNRSLGNQSWSELT
jgi:hypothetical protein